MNIAILGYGLQGQAALQYWQELDAANQLTVCDQNTQITVPDGIQTQLGDAYLENLDRFDILVRTPVLHPRDITAANPQSPDILNKVTTVTNEFFRVCPTRNIIGVTGTKGKGTTSTLITKILEAAGKTVHLGGNIGIPPLSMLANNIRPDDWVVLELANFQLIDLNYSPHIGVCVMMSPEHLDWHADNEEYVQSKARMFAQQTSDDLAVFNRLSPDSARVVHDSPAPKISYEVPDKDAQPTATSGVYVAGDTIFIDETPVCKTTDVALPGRHNLQNVCAAIAATWEVINKEPESVIAAVRQVSGLPYRLELVREVDGVKYYNDSFGTTPETAIAAVEAFEQPEILILGGSSKGAEFDDLARVVADSNVRSVVMIEGDTAPEIRQALTAAGFTNIISGGTTMTEIVTAAQQAAQPGDVVLLSAACASFGLFQNYKDRGDQFNQVVLALE